MRNIWTIARRDFKTYFTSPIAYIIIGVYIAIMDFMFYMGLYSFHIKSLQYQQFNMGKAQSIADGIIRPTFANMNVIFLFLVPFITMRLFAEEKKVHTIELLMTSPVSLAEIVMGKFLSALLLVLVMLGFTTIYPIILFATGNPDLGPILTSYVGTLLSAGCYLSMGILFSAMTENQIVAGALTLGAALFFLIVSWGAMAAGPVWGEVLQYVSLVGHFNNFAMGLVDTSDVVFYFSFIGIALFLTHRVLESYRWRS